MHEKSKTASELKILYWFTGSLDADMKQHLAKVDTNDLKVVLRVNYTTTDGSAAVLDIVVPANKVVEYANTPIEPYFETTIRGLNGVGDATITVCAVYGDIVIPGAVYNYTAITE